MKVFIIHSSRDKPFVRELALQLASHHIDSWIDEAEIHYGESLIDKIASAIETIDAVVAVLSPHSVDSSWVRKELSLAMTKEILARRVTVIPVLAAPTDIPFFLRDKLYADFTGASDFASTASRLADSIRWHTTPRQQRPVATPLPGESMLPAFTHKPSYVFEVAVIAAMALMLAVLWMLKPEVMLKASYWREPFHDLITAMTLCMVLPLIGIMITYMIKAAIRIDRNLADALGGILVWSVLNPRYCAVMRQHWRLVHVKIIVFAELAVFLVTLIVADRFLHVLGFLFIVTLAFVPC